MPEAVREAIIEPMLVTYLPPQQVRHDSAARNRALAEYTKTLAPFDRETLERAWELVKATHLLVIWPAPGTIAEACRQCQPKPRPPTEEERQRQKSLAMADAYTARYMKTSHLAQLARQEQWADRLREYVAATAWVQAQMICQVRHIGWDKLLLPDGERYRSSQAAFEAIRPALARQVEKGTIQVHIPQARIRQWKDEAQHQRSPAS
jgi:hypothetical protein